MLALSVVFYLIAFLVAWPLPRMLGVNGPRSGTYRYLLAFPNIGFIGNPVIRAIFGLLFILLAFTVGIRMLKRTGGTL